MKRTSKIISGIAIILGTIWTGAFIGGYLLPDGWASPERGPWWGPAMLGTFVLSGVAGCAAGIWRIAWALSESD